MWTHRLSMMSLIQSSSLLVRQTLGYSVRDPIDLVRLTGLQDLKPESLLTENRFPSKKHLDIYRRSHGFSDPYAQPFLSIMQIRLRIKLLSICLCVSMRHTLTALQLTKPQSIGLVVDHMVVIPGVNRLATHTLSSVSSRIRSNAIQSLTKPIPITAHRVLEDWVLVYHSITMCH